MICRRVDNMGRIVIPQEMRNKLGITHETVIDINLKGNKIELRKSNLSCSVCGDTGDMLGDTGVCVSCAKKIAAKLAQSDASR